MYNGLPTLDDFEFKDKRVILRVDFNCPIEDGQIADDTRIKASLPTIKELLDKGAKRIIILSHQGRKGRKDFISLKQHAKRLEELMGLPVSFNEIKDGVVLMENVRFDEEETLKKTPEEHAESKWVQNLASQADIFINDAFASAHRSQRSTVGFIPLLPSGIGRLMERELRALDMLLNGEHPVVYCFGGVKLDNMHQVVHDVLASGRADKVLLGGLVGLAFLKASGINLDFETKTFLESRASLEFYVGAVQVYEEFKDKIILPVDHAFVVNGERKEAKQPASQVFDIGKETIELFSSQLSNASTVFISGPMGKFEDERFRRGTQAILKAACSAKFSYAGGGHTGSALKMLGIDCIDYTSTAGGAVERVVRGKTLPVVEAIRSQAQP